MAIPTTCLEAARRGCDGATLLRRWHKNLSPTLATTTWTPCTMKTPPRLSTLCRSSVTTPKKLVQRTRMDAAMASRPAQAAPILKSPDSNTTITTTITFGGRSGHFLQSYNLPARRAACNCMLAVQLGIRTGTPSSQSPHRPCSSCYSTRLRRAGRAATGRMAPRSRSKLCFLSMTSRPLAPSWRGWRIRGTSTHSARRTRPWRRSWSGLG
mmetsp:Transcript_29532/g.77442  ORF Transcript_29532/g.77442 Transcript_29532/m.77442 type:complete len:211 (-) Transcript_29532:1771-2403(-)